MDAKIETGTRDEFTIHRAAVLLAKKWGPEGAAGRKRQREQERAMTAQIIPFPMPVAPPPRHGDPVTAAYVKLIGEATRLELAGINPPNWKDHVDAVLDKAYSELD